MPDLTQAMKIKANRDRADLLTFCFLRDRDAEIAWNHSGHWHAAGIPCPANCPARDAAWVTAFRSIITQA